MSPRPPKWILALALALSLGIVVSALAGLWVSAGAGNWVRAGFEALLLTAGVFGALTGLGFFRGGPAMALTCVGGAAFFATVITFITRTGRPTTAGTEMVIAILTDPHAGARLAASLLFGMLAAATLMARRPGPALRYLAIGLILLAPVAAMAAAWRWTALGGWIGGLNPVVVTLLAVVGFLLVVALVSTGLHNLIRALEVGRPDPDAPVNAQGPGAGATKAAEG